MRYTIQDFWSQFPDDDSCLEYLFQSRFDSPCPHCGTGKFYRVKKRKCYACSICAFQIYPLAGTIFHKSRTKLTLWFFAMFLFSQSRNGVSALELQRHLGVTYKCAWRMLHRIRSVMNDDGEILSGTVETDETYIGGRWRFAMGGKGKETVIGILQRGGKVKAKHVEGRFTHLLLNNLQDNVSKDAKLYSDQFNVYRKLKRLGFDHESVNHSKKEYVRGDIHTNSIEGFWSYMKRPLDGTYHTVSPKYLQLYLDEFSFRYSLRKSPVSIFHHLLTRVVR